MHMKILANILGKPTLKYPSHDLGWEIILQVHPH
jgi:hypothetical protein